MADETTIVEPNNATPNVAWTQFTQEKEQIKFPPDMDKKSQIRPLYTGKQLLQLAHNGEPMLEIKAEDTVQNKEEEKQTSDNDGR